MYKDEYKAVCNSAATKLNLLKTNPLGYFVASIRYGVLRRIQQWDFQQYHVNEFCRNISIKGSCTRRQCIWH